MRSEKDVEAYLLRLNRRYRNVEGETGTFLIHTTNDMPPIALRVDPPLVVMRIHVGDMDGESPALMRRLLELNARALVHASYGLEGNRIVLSSALELENLDFNEIGATLDEIDMALLEQMPMLAQLKHH